MDKIKIVFFDIDGTLVDMSKKRITPKTLEALNRLKEKGILICIATGRAPITLPRFDGITFDAFLTFNGSLCYNSTQDIFRNPIPSDDVKTIIQNAASIGRPVSVASRTALAANGMEQDLIDYYSIVNLSVEISETFDQIIERDDIYQIMLGCRENEYDALLRNAPGARITAWWDRAADIIPAGGSKGIGIKKILEYYQIAPSEAMAFGDGNNDIEMIQTVGHGIAMANASPELKAAACDVCGHAAEDGIYYYLKDRGLI